MRTINDLLVAMRRLGWAEFRFTSHYDGDCLSFTKGSAQVRFDLDHGKVHLYNWHMPLPKTLKYVDGFGHIMWFEAHHACEYLTSYPEGQFAAMLANVVALLEELDNI